MTCVDLPSSVKELHFLLLLLPELYLQTEAPSQVSLWQQTLRVTADITNIIFSMISLNHIVKIHVFIFATQ